MGTDDQLTAQEWKSLWGQSDTEEENEDYVLPKIYPGPKIRCPNCGYWQGNETVLDTYRWCMRCCTVLQDPHTLYNEAPLALGPFKVVAASYGHPLDPKLAFDVRSLLQDRVGVADRLEIRAREALLEWLGNPCPGDLKTLRIRYVFLQGVARGQRREVWLHERKEGHLAKDLSLRVPTSLPLVILFSATYGSPGGASRGRGSFDVTEFMQGRVDLAGGKHLFLSKEESLVDLFGDPCPGRDKCLMLHYEILGTEGKVDGLESDGRLLTPISISCTPMLAPLVIIESATYGQTREGIDDRLQRVQRDLSDLLSLQNRKDMGMPTSRDDNIRLLHLRPRIAELGYLESVTPKHFDVASALQKRVGELGGGVLELVAAKEDLNGLAGNPLPGKDKELRVHYLVVGHDSERLTSLEESTTSGYPRNYILQRKGNVVVQVKDDQRGRGVLERDVLVDSPKVLSVIEILSSSYGHPRKSTKTYDISTKLRTMIDIQGGEKLVIDSDANLLRLFDEPCRGVRKKLKIAYVARGLHGRIRVKERDRRLVADVVVGYYSRDGFQKSELLAERYGLSATASTIAAASKTTDSAEPHTRNFPNDSNIVDNASSGGNEDGLEGEKLACNRRDRDGAFKSSPERRCSSFENRDTDERLESALPSVIPRLHIRGVDNGHDKSVDSSRIAEGIEGPCPLAELRRFHRRERRHAHQDVIRRKVDERESETRRLRAVRDQRAREAARAATEAGAAERIHELQLAEKAEKAAPWAKRLFRTMRRKATDATTTDKPLSASGSAKATATGRQQITAGEKLAGDGDLIRSTDEAAAAAGDDNEAVDVDAGKS